MSSLIFSCLNLPFAHFLLFFASLPLSPWAVAALARHGWVLPCDFKFLYPLFQIKSTNWLHDTAVACITKLKPEALSLVVALAGGRQQENLDQRNESEAVTRSWSVSRQLLCVCYSTAVVGMLISDQLPVMNVFVLESILGDREQRKWAWLQFIFQP